ncbi:MAG: hypothetical protein NC098_02940 [Lachnoclostridium sp.]|nr:hypothetical protein [Lachnoclostridium sp.]
MTSSVMWIFIAVIVLTISLVAASISRLFTRRHQPAMNISTSHTLKRL